MFKKHCLGDYEVQVSRGKMNKNYENCKKGIHKITNSRFIKGKEIKSCHCGKYTDELDRRGTPYLSNKLREVALIFDGK